MFGMVFLRNSQIIFRSAWSTSSCLPATRTAVLALDGFRRDIEVADAVACFYAE